MLTAPEAGGSESRVSLEPSEGEMNCGRKNDLLRPPSLWRCPPAAPGSCFLQASAWGGGFSLGSCGCGSLAWSFSFSCARGVQRFPLAAFRFGGSEPGPRGPGVPGGLSGRLRPVSGRDTRRAAPVSPARGARPRVQQVVVCVTSSLLLSLFSCFLCQEFLLIGCSVFWIDPLIFITFSLSLSASLVTFWGGSLMSSS